MNFIEKYANAREEKNSILCVGLDPAPAGMRSENVMPKKYATKDPGEGALKFCLNIIKETGEHACAVKANSQYILFPMNFNQLKRLNEAAHDAGLVSILDHKLADIGSSNQAALYWTREAGFDAITFSPYAGNIKETEKIAHEYGLGFLVLTYTSNPESKWIQRDFTHDGKPLYEEISDRVKNGGSDELVVGATGHITWEDIKKIRNIVGKKKVILFPGIGAQGGDVKKIIEYGGNNILINVGRSIIYDPNPGERAREYKDLFNKFRG